MVSRNILVIAPDARRASIKVASEDPMTEVLARACGKLNLSPDKYLLRANKSHLDLSVAFGALRLPAGASLDLVVKSVTPTAVSVALQLPPAASVPYDATKLPEGRLVHTFRSDTTLWKVLRQFEEVVARAAGLAALNLTDRGVAQTTAGSEGSGSGLVFWEAPVLVLMRREVTTLADFGKTLSQLGYNSGRVLARLSFRKTGKPLAQAMADILEFFGEEEEQGPREEKQPEVAGQTESRGISAVEEDAPAAVPGGAESAAEESSNGATPTTTTEDTQPEEAGGESMALDGAPPAPPAPIAPAPTEAPPGDSSTTTAIQRLAIYSPTSSTTVHAAQTRDPDSAFTPSIALAQLHQAQLQAASQNKRLLSDDEIAAQEAEKAAKLARVASVEVKVRFPDNWAVDWRCLPAATGAHLYQAVKEVMAAQDRPFKLVLPDRTTVRDAGGEARRESLITGYKLAGRVLVNFRWGDSVPEAVRSRAKEAFLKESVRQQAQTLVVPDTPPEEEEAEQEPKVAPPKPARHDGGKDGGNGPKKIPKWLKLSK